MVRSWYIFNHRASPTGLAIVRAQQWADTDSSMDVAASVAPQVAAILVPALPYLLGKVGERAADEAGKRLGAEAWQQAKALWAKLSPSVQARPATVEAVEDAAAHPDDEDVHIALRVQLRKLLSEDQALAADVARIVGSGGSLTYQETSGTGHMVVGRDIRGSTIVHGGVVNQLGHATRDEFDDFAHAGWFARLVMVLSAILIVIGFGLALSVVVEAFTQPFPNFDGPDPSRFAYGVVFVFAGLVVHGLGRFLARLNRRR